MKKGRKAESGIQRERGKNEKEIKRKGDREKGTRRKRQGKKREKVKERESFIAVTWSRKKHREKKSPWPRGGPGPAPKSLQHPI